jgi:hypothetical protein
MNSRIQGRTDAKLRNLRRALNSYKLFDAGGRLHPGVLMGDHVNHQSHTGVRSAD